MSDTRATLRSERPDTARILAGLKPFQRRSVDYVYDRLYGADRTRRFLLADEVGLGKTLVARGVIAMAGFEGDSEKAITGEPEQIAETLRGFREAGFRHFLASLDPCTPETVAAYGRIIELVG